MKVLNELRKSKNFNSSQMAEFIGVSESLYTKIECGNRQPSRFFMQKLKSAFPDCDMNIFFINKLHK